MLAHLRTAAYGLPLVLLVVASVPSGAGDDGEPATLLRHETADSPRLGALFPEPSPPGSAFCPPAPDRGFPAWTGSPRRIGPWGLREVGGGRCLRTDIFVVATAFSPEDRLAPHATLPGRPARLLAAGPRNTLPFYVRQE